jgi:hypothetical protein
LIAGAATTGQAGVKEPSGPLQFGVEKAKINWGTYLQDILRSRGSASSQFQSYSGRGPSVVIQNERGEKLVIEVTKTAKEARDRAADIEKDYKRLSAAQWCERYDVPDSSL